MTGTIIVTIILAISASIMLFLHAAEITQKPSVDKQELRIIEACEKAGFTEDEIEEIISSLHQYYHKNKEFVLFEHCVDAEMDRIIWKERLKKQIK